MPEPTRPRPLPLIDAPLLARVAHHELAGPLALQSALLAAAGDRAAGTGEPSPELDLARECAHDMLGVLDLLVALAGAGSPPAPCPLDRVVATASRGRDVTVRLTRPAAGSAVDARLAPALLTNLLVNAGRHARCPVDLLGSLDRGRVRLDLRQPGERPTGVVTALARTVPPAGRQGLGLWLVRRLAEQMGGTVTSRAVPASRGWALRVVLPVAA